MRLRRILIEADRPQARAALAAALAGLGVRAVDAPDAAELALVHARHPAAGIERVRELRTRHAALPCALLLAACAPRAVRRAFEAGALDVVPAPADPEALAVCLERLAHLVARFEETERVRSAAEEGDQRELAVHVVNRPIAEIERVAILATLASARGNKTEAARRLGVTARTVSNKLKTWRTPGRQAAGRGEPS